MFIPNTTAQLYRKTGRTAFGTAQFAAPVTVNLAVVDLGDIITPTAVRADHSASRGAADIDTLTAKLLLPGNVSVSEGDVILVNGLYVDIDGKATKRNVLGEVDHYEVSGNIKGDMPA